jgi:hypothetical protein
MTALLLALFGGAALLAVASMMATVKHYAAAVLAIMRQSGGSANPDDPVLRKHLAYARRLKAQPGWRARSRARRAGRELRRSGNIAGQLAIAARKSVHNRQYGFSMALVSDTLMPE